MTTVSTGYNQYDLSSIYGNSMAHDYFGSQAFGTNITGTTQQAAQAAQTQTAQTVQTSQEQSVQNIFETPKTQASSLLQAFAYYKELQNSSQVSDGSSQTVSDTNQPADNSQVQASSSQTTNTMPTIQDYYMAAMIANQFANDIPLLYSNTSFVDNDYFAKNTFLSGNNQSGLSYTA